MRTVIFENNLLCTSGDFLGNTEKNQCICCFCSLRWIILVSDQLRCFTAARCGLGWVLLFSSANSAPFHFGTGEGVGAGVNAISFYSGLHGVSYKGGMGEWPPAWHGVCGSSLTGIYVWIMGALRAERAGCQHSPCPCLTFQAAPGENAALVGNIQPSL